jgi:hypothetical protein
VENKVDISHFVAYEKFTKINHISRNDMETEFQTTSIYFKLLFLRFSENFCNELTVKSLLMDASFMHCVVLSVRQIFDTRLMMMMASKVEAAARKRSGEE